MYSFHSGVEKDGTSPMSLMATREPFDLSFASLRENERERKEKKKKKIFVVRMRLYMC